MLKRTLVFSSPVSLSLKNAQLVVTYKELPDEIRSVPIEDVGIVLIEHQMSSITMPLINALSDANVALIICDRRGMPNVYLQSMDQNNLQGEVLRNQLDAGEVLKKNLWKQIVECKIRNQANLLTKLNRGGEMLKPFYQTVKSGDSDNREGTAAKIYWPLLFGSDFVRNRDLDGVNSLLNYGYSVLRAAVARALCASGLFPALGIYHHNRSNAFPLADDVMEPYRPYVDEIVYDLWRHNQTELNKETKAKLINVTYSDTIFENLKRPLSVGLSFTTSSLAKCYAKEDKQLSYPVMPCR